MIQMRRGLRIKKLHWARYWTKLYEIIVRRDVASVWRVAVDDASLSFEGFTRMERSTREILAEIESTEAMDVVAKRQEMIARLNTLFSVLDTHVIEIGQLRGLFFDVIGPNSWYDDFVEDDVAEWAVGTGAAVKFWSDGTCLLINQVCGLV